MPTPEVAVWFRNELGAAINDLTGYRRRQAVLLAKRKTEFATMQDRLLNAYLAGTVEEAAYKAKSNELKADAAKTEESMEQLGDVDPGPRKGGAGALRLDAERRTNVARFKQCDPSRDTGCDLFEPYFDRLNSCHRKEKALRRSRRRAQS